MARLQFFVGLSAAAILGAGLATSAEAAKPISFGGYTWTVRPNGDGLPGPSHWRAANAFLDTDGALHLKLTHKGKTWYSVELQTVESLGFGTYQFWVDTRVDNFDPNVVFAMFNYPVDSSLDGTNEIDMEFGKWGDPKAHALDYVVYPAKAGKSASGWDFKVKDTSAENTHRFTWTPTGVKLESLAGHQNGTTGRYAIWSFKPDKPKTLVPQKPMPVHINLWLSGGAAPTDGKDVEVVIRRFDFTPSH
jgi:hypothetical protein